MSLFPRLPKKFWWQLAHDPKDKYLPLSGDGTPDATNTQAQSLGQVYVDTNQRKAYIATTLTGVPLNDWAILN